jgi:hypothetical protein
MRLQGFYTYSKMVALDSKQQPSIQNSFSRSHLHKSIIVAIKLLAIELFA